MGAEAVRKLLMKLDLVRLSEVLRVDLAETGSKQKAIPYSRFWFPWQRADLTD